MPRRAADTTDLPAPERAGAAIIARCRTEIESSTKARIRALLLPFVKWHFKMAELGEGFHWPKGLRMRIAPGSRIGRYAYLGAGFECEGPVVVGDLCMIAADMKIVGADHLYDRVGTPTRLAFPDSPRTVTTFGADVWTGQRVTLFEGLTIGTGAVIGSGSVVTKDVAPYTIVAGVPARPIKPRFTDEERAAHEAAIMA